MLLIKQGEANEPGLGEDLYKYMEKGGEMPEVYDDYPKNDSPEAVKELIMKMTAYHAGDRPSAEDVVSVLKKVNSEVNSLAPEIERSPALPLLQALNDKSQAAIDDCVAAPDVKDWINDHVDRTRLDYRLTYVVGTQHVTCLTFASYVSPSCTVRHLVEAGSDVTARDSCGRTPLHMACLSRVEANSKVVFLLQQDASLVNAADYSSDTPLHNAARGDNSDVVKTLLHHGADVDARGQLGRTALHAACIHGHVDCVHELMAGCACHTLSPLKTC